MSESSATYEFISKVASEQVNGKQGHYEPVDNRLQLNVDGRFVETWELIAMEGMKISDWLMIFPRYLARGDRLVSPGLPDKPLDELTPSEIAEIRESEAYKMLKRFKLPNLKAAAESFAKQAAEFSTDPNS